MSHLTESNEWKALEAHFQDAKTWHMRNLFAKDPARAKKFSAEACGLFLDYSKNIITEETLNKLFDLLKSTGFEAKRDQFFKGEKINHTEKRAVLHTALIPRQKLHYGRWQRCDARSESCIKTHGRIHELGSQWKMERSYWQVYQICCEYWYWWF